MFILFAITNLIDVCGELFIQKHLFKEKKKTVLFDKIISGKKISIFKITVYTTLAGLALTVAAICAFVFGFGVRDCPAGTY